MPILVNIQNGSVSGGTLTNGCNFDWENPTSVKVELTGCGGFCTQASYSVHPNSTTPATMLTTPPGPFTFTETPNEWNAPGQPRITVSPVPTHREKEVA